MIAKKVPPSPAINVWGIDIGLDVQLNFLMSTIWQHFAITKLPKLFLDLKGNFFECLKHHSILIQ